MAKILVIEDDADFQETVTEALRTEFHTVEGTVDGADGWYRLTTSHFDIAIVDWDLPGLSGEEICKKYRQQPDAQTLILMLTGKSSGDDIEAGLKAGADDYLAKPCSTRELLARVRALLRRAGAAPPQDKLRFENLLICPGTMTATLNGEPIGLSRKEFDLLLLFIRNPQRVYTIESLLRDVWSDSPDAAEATVRTHIKTLRKKIDEGGAESLIETVHGAGYRLRSQQSGR